MAKKKKRFSAKDLSFNFGANARPKKPKRTTRGNRRRSFGS